MRWADKLRVTYSNVNHDCMIHFPLGIGTKCDGHWLSGIFNKAFTNELTKRGYDVSTLKFTVEPNLALHADKFPSLAASNAKGG